MKTNFEEKPFGGFLLHSPILVSLFAVEGEKGKKRDEGEIYLLSEAN